MSPQEAYDQLALYTLSLQDHSFIHQYIVDAYAAQNADESTKSITVYFALAGLYLHLEKNYSGREVQLAHMEMAKTKKEWPKFDLPNHRGTITVYDILKANEGEERAEMIKKWSADVWEAYKESQARVREFVNIDLGLK